MRRGTAAGLVVLAVLSAGVGARAQPSTIEPVWSADIGAHSILDDSRGHLYVNGGQPQAQYGSILPVRALDMETGAEVWRAPGWGWRGGPMVLAPDGSRLYTFRDGGDLSAGLGALDPTDGSVVASYPHIQSGLLAAGDDVVFVSRRIVDDIHTSRIDPDTGNVEWSAIFDHEGWDDEPAGIALSPDGSTLLVQRVWGNSGYCPFTCSGIMTIAYDSATGSQRWIATLETTAMAPISSALVIDPTGRRAFVVGSKDEYAHVYQPSIGSVTFYARSRIVVAYDLGTGTELWRGASPLVVSGRYAEQLPTNWLAVAPDGDTVYVRSSRPQYESPVYGHSRPQPTGETLAMSALDGAIRWIIPQGESGGPMALSADGSRLFLTDTVTGLNPQPEPRPPVLSTLPPRVFFFDDLTRRALAITVVDTATGAVQRHARYAGASFVADLEVHADMVFAVGSRTLGFHLPAT